MKINPLTFLILIIMFGCNAGTGSNEETNVEVVISNGKLQCQDNAISIGTSKSNLTDSGILVKQEGCGVQKGVDFPAVCGAATGQFHIFTISEDDLNKAENIGFISSSNFEEGFELVACNSL